jgi:hypothetical protein
VLGLDFADGSRVKKDFTSFVSKAPGRLAKLADLKFFGRVRVNDETGTIEWPGQIDLCPESLAGRSVR